MMQINQGTRSASVSPEVLNHCQGRFLQELGKTTQNTTEHPLKLLLLFARVILPNHLHLKFQERWISLCSSLLCDSRGMHDVMFGVSQLKAVDSTILTPCDMASLPLCRQTAHTHLSLIASLLLRTVFLRRSWQMLKELLKDMTTPREFYIAGPRKRAPEHLNICVCSINGIFVLSLGLNGGPQVFTAAGKS